MRNDDFLTDIGAPTPLPAPHGDGLLALLAERPGRTRGILPAGEGGASSKTPPKKPVVETPAERAPKKTTPKVSPSSTAALEQTVTGAKQTKNKPKTPEPRPNPQVEDVILDRKRKTKPVRDPAKAEERKDDAKVLDKKYTPKELKKIRAEQDQLERKEHKVRKKHKVEDAPEVAPRNKFEQTEQNEIDSGTRTTRKEKITDLRQEHIDKYGVWIDKDGTVYSAELTEEGRIAATRQVHIPAQGEQPALTETREVRIGINNFRRDIGTQETVPTGKEGEVKQKRVESTLTGPRGRTIKSHISLQQEQENKDGSITRTRQREDYGPDGKATERVEQTATVRTSGEVDRERYRTKFREDGTTAEWTQHFIENVPSEGNGNPTSTTTDTYLRADGVTPRHELVVEDGWDANGNEPLKTIASTDFDKAGNPLYTFLRRESYTGELPEGTPWRSYTTWSKDGSVGKRVYGDQKITESEFEKYVRTGKEPHYVEEDPERLAELEDEADELREIVENGTTYTGSGHRNLNDAAQEASEKLGELEDLRAAEEANEGKLWDAPAGIEGSGEAKTYKRGGEAGLFEEGSVDTELAPPLESSTRTPSVFEVPAMLESRANAAAIDNSIYATDEKALARLQREQKEFQNAFDAAPNDAQRERLLRQYFTTHDYWVDNQGGEPLLMASGFSEGTPDSDLFGGARLADPHASLARTDITGKDEQGNPATYDVVRHIYADGSQDDIVQEHSTGPRGYERTSVTGEHYTMYGVLTERDTHAESTVPRTTQGLEPLAVTEISRERFDEDTGKPVGDQYAAISRTDSQSTSLEEVTNTYTADSVLADTKFENTSMSRNYDGELVDDFLEANAAALEAASGGKDDFNPNDGNHDEITTPPTGSFYTHSLTDVDYDASGNPVFQVTDEESHTVKKSDTGGVSVTSTDTTRSLGERGGHEIIMDEAGNPLVSEVLVTNVRSSEFDHDSGVAGGDKSDGHQFRLITDMTVGTVTDPDGTVSKQWATPLKIDTLNEGQDDDWKFERKYLKTELDGSLSQDEDGNPVELVNEQPRVQGRGYSPNTVPEKEQVYGPDGELMDLPNGFEQADLDGTDYFESAMEGIGGKLVAVGAIAAGIAAVPFSGGTSLALTAVGVGLATTAFAATAINYKQGEASGWDLALSGAGVLTLGAGGLLKGASYAKGLSATRAAAASGDDVVRGAADDALTQGRGTVIATRATDTSGLTLDGIDAYDATRMALQGNFYGAGLMLFAIGGGVGALKVRNRIDAKNAAQNAPDPTVTDPNLPDTTDGRLPDNSPGNGSPDSDLPSGNLPNDTLPDVDQPNGNPPNGNPNGNVPGSNTTGRGGLGVRRNPDAGNAGPRLPLDGTNTTRDGANGAPNPAPALDRAPAADRTRNHRDDAPGAAGRVGSPRSDRYRQHVPDAVRARENELWRELNAQNPNIRTRPEDVVWIDRMPSGQIVFLSRGSHFRESGNVGGAHILGRHWREQFSGWFGKFDPTTETRAEYAARMSDARARLPEMLRNALVNGEIVGLQGGRPIYRFTDPVTGTQRTVAIDVSDQGFIIGANPKTVRARETKALHAALEQGQTFPGRIAPEVTGAAGTASPPPPVSGGGLRPTGAARPDLLRPETLVAPAATRTNDGPLATDPNTLLNRDFPVPGRPGHTSRIVGVHEFDGQRAFVVDTGPAGQHGIAGQRRLVREGELAQYGIPNPDPARDIATRQLQDPNFDGNAALAGLINDNPTSLLGQTVRVRRSESAVNDGRAISRTSDNWQVINTRIDPVTGERTFTVQRRNTQDHSQTLEQTVTTRELVELNRARLEGDHGQLPTTSFVVNGQRFGSVQEADAALGNDNASRAQQHLDAFHDWYYAAHGRPANGGREVTIEFSSDPAHANNAFRAGDRLIIGSSTRGDIRGGAFSPGTLAHEAGHGQFADAAGPSNYRNNERSALDEAIGDYYGAAFENDWAIGRGFFTDGTNFRDVETGANLVTHYGEYQRQGAIDARAGVEPHAGSGVVSSALHSIQRQLGWNESNRLVDGAINDPRLRQNADFRSFSDALRQQAIQRYGSVNDPRAQAVLRALDERGLVPRFEPGTPVQRLRSTGQLDTQHGWTVGGTLPNGLVRLNGVDANGRQVYADVTPGQVLWGAHRNPNDALVDPNAGHGHAHARPDAGPTPAPPANLPPVAPTNPIDPAATPAARRTVRDWLLDRGFSAAGLRNITRLDVPARDAVSSLRRLAHLPQTAVDALNGASMRSFLFGRGRDLPSVPGRENLRGVETRPGEGRIWDQVPGAGGRNGFASRAGNNHGHDHGSVDLELHEASHAVDAALGDVSSTPQWMNGAQREVRASGREDAYLTEHPVEWFAESMARYSHSRASNRRLAREYPETHRTLMDVVGPPRFGLRGAGSTARAAATRARDNVATAASTTLGRAHLPNVALPRIDWSRPGAALTNARNNAALSAAGTLDRFGVPLTRRSLPSMPRPTWESFDAGVARVRTNTNGLIHGETERQLNQLETQLRELQQLIEALT